MRHSGVSDLHKKLATTITKNFGPPFLPKGFVRAKAMVIVSDSVVRLEIGRRTAFIREDGRCCDSAVDLVSSSVAFPSHKHEWTPLAREETPGDVEHDGQLWSWCIKCGRLKLGRMIFTPGPHQRKTIVEDR